jgi:hypothetical protein
VPPPPWLVDLEEGLAAETGGDTDLLATALVVLASVAGASVPVDEEERRGATRRALLRLAAGGDPSRGLDLNGPAVTELAEELRDIDRQLALETGFRELAAQSAGLPHVSEALHGLMHAPDIGWRAYACSLLAEDLGAE